MYIYNIFFIKELNKMDTTKALSAVVDYIRGNSNLENAIKELEIIGLDKKSIRKTLKDTPRDNIIEFKKNII